MSKTAVATRGVVSTPPSAISDTAALIAALTKASRDPDVDIVKMQWLMEARTKLMAEAAERAFDDALAEAEAEMAPIAKDADNPHTRSKYATYVALDRALRPIYTRHGFSLSFNTSPAAPEGFVRVLCYVTCKGHKRTYEIDMPADGKGAKGGEVMTRTHATGSAVTYGKRYLLKMIFNIAEHGDASDDDGNAAAAIPKQGDPIITRAQVNELKKIMKLADVEDAIILEHFKVRAIEQLSLAQFKTAKNKCNRKISLQNA